MASREKTLFNLDDSYYLYDLTLTYFEGKCEGNPQAKRGYSRDQRPDCKQVVIGLVLDRDGFPKAHEIFDGNRQDRSSVDEMLQTLEQRTGRKGGGTVIVDRGMAFDENLQQIQARGHHYVVACRQTERLQWFAEIEDEQDWQEILREPSPTNPAQKKSRVWVKRLESADHLFILCRSEGRQAKDRAIREKQEKRLLADVKRLQARVAKKRIPEAKIHEAIGRLKERYPRVARCREPTYFVTAGIDCDATAQTGTPSLPAALNTQLLPARYRPVKGVAAKRTARRPLTGRYLANTPEFRAAVSGKRSRTRATVDTRYHRLGFDSGKWELLCQEETEAKAKALRMDGVYLLKTDRNLGTEEAWRIYILLTRVENAFRDLKSPLPRGQPCADSSPPTRLSLWFCRCLLANRSRSGRAPSRRSSISSSTTRSASPTRSWLPSKPTCPTQNSDEKPTATPFLSTLYGAKRGSWVRVRDRAAHGVGILRLKIR